MKVVDCQFGGKYYKKSLNREKKCDYKAHEKWDVWHTLSKKGSLYIQNMASTNVRK